MKKETIKQDSAYIVAVIAKTENWYNKTFCLLLFFLKLIPIGDKIHKLHYNLMVHLMFFDIQSWFLQYDFGVKMNIPVVGFAPMHFPNAYEIELNQNIYWRMLNLKIFGHQKFKIEFTPDPHSVTKIDDFVF